MMIKIGLTGGIGSGKSYVANLCQQWGAAVVDTDVIAHQLTAPGGAAINAIAQEFGPQYLTAEGAMCREAMRELVFTQPEQRQRLQRLLHPLIRQLTFRQVEQAQGSYVLVVIPLLVESGQWQAHLDRICVVDCDVATQVTRVVQRNNLTPEQVQRIMATQATRAQRLAVANDIITNDHSTTLKQLTEQAQHMHTKWCQLSTL